MEVLRKTRQAQKARINVESMVSFDGVNQYASAGVAQNVNNLNLLFDFSVSFFGYVTSTTILYQTFFNLIGSTRRIGIYANYGAVRVFLRDGLGTNQDYSVGQAFKPNSINHIVFNYKASGISHFWVNGRRFGSGKTFSFAQNWSGSNELRLAADNNYEIEGGLSHLTFFNRTLTPQEIQYIHAQGGLLPASVHAACVAHYPCTHREGNTLYDVVGQYNYAKATPLIPYHATLQNFTPEQHTGDNQTAWKDFYTKQDLRPYVDSNSDGTPDSPLVEKSSLLPPFQNALQFATGKEMQCGNVGSIQGIRFAVKQGAANQPLLTLDNTPNTNVSVNAGTLTTGAGITNLQIYVDGNLQSAADAGAILNDLKLHDVVLLFDAVSATDMRITAADKHLASLFVLSNKINRKQIIKLANNTLLSQPETRTQDNISNLYNLNQITDNGGTYEIANELGASVATLSGYSAAEVDPNDPSYVLTDINSLR